MVIETAVIVAIITGCFGVLGQWIVAKKGREEDAKIRAVKEKEVEMRLDAISEKLDIHNGYAEKLGDVAISLAEIRTEIKLMKEKG